MLRRRRRPLAVAAGFACCCLISRIQAKADDTFIGLPAGGTGSWSDPANWSSGLPGPSDVTNVSNTDGINRNIILDVSASIDDLVIGNVGGTNTLYQSPDVDLTAPTESLGAFAPNITSVPSVIGAHIQNGGTNNIGTLGIGGYSGTAFSGSKGTYVLNDGTLNTSLLVGYRDGEGTFEQNGGFVSGDVYVAYMKGSAGTYNMNAGALVTDRETVGTSGTGTIVQSGGTNTVHDRLELGYSSGGATGIYILNGLDAQLFVDNYLILGDHSAGTFIQSAGTVHVAWLSISGSSLPGTYALSGGSLLADSVHVGNNTGSGSLTMTDGVLNTPSLTVSSTGTFIYSGGSLSVSSLTLLTVGATNLGGHMTLAPGLGQTLSLKGFSLSSKSVLDLADNPLIYDYDNPIANPSTGQTQVDVMRNYLQTGELTSSLTDASHRLGYADNQVLGLDSFAGQSVDATSLLVKLTFAGDANLDGKVDMNDVYLLAQNWLSSGQLWTGGDFNYDGTVNATDLGLLALNWQAGVSGASDEVAFDDAVIQVGLSPLDVPEPATAAFGGICAVGILDRRRR